MSGGDIIDQGKGEHQVVIFIFAGRLNKDDVIKWNTEIQALKKRFAGSIMGVTLQGEKSLGIGKPTRSKKK
jgi:hypothetical protein